MTVCLITGATGGIGAETARQLAEQPGPLTLILTGRSQSGLDTLLSTLPSASDKHYALFPCDLADRNDIQALIKHIFKQYKRLDQLVHCAGSMEESLLIMTREQVLSDHITFNLTNSIFLVQQAAKLMQRHKAGQVVLFSSLVANQPGTGQSVYAAAKAGLEGFVTSWSREAGQSGIRINAIAPGFIDTQLVAHYDEQQRAALCAKTSMGRLGKPEDIAGVVKFLLSPAANYITGQIISVDGGLNL